MKKIIHDFIGMLSLRSMKGMRPYKQSQNSEFLFLPLELVTDDKISEFFKNFNRNRKKDNGNLELKYEISKI